MKFKLHIRGRDDLETAPVANLANPLIQALPISGLAGLAEAEVCNSAQHFALPGCAGLAAAMSDKQERRNTELEAQRFTESLLAAAMRCCDHHKDSDAAREQMRLDCLNTPLHLRADLLDHFQQTYPKAKS